MAVCGLRTVLLIICVLELIVTVQRQVFDFLGYMWLPIILNFINILLTIFGSFGAVQYITKYLFAFAIWSILWFTWNIFLICYYLNLGSLNRESGMLSLGTGSVSWWEGNGWGCHPVWGDVEEGDAWRPARVEGCLLPWHHVELAQSIGAALLTFLALPIALLLAYRSFMKHSTVSDKSTLSRRPVYTIELSTTETNLSENSLKPMTPRRVKRRSGSRGTGSSVRRSRRSYRNAGYLASTASLPREGTASRPTSAHSSYSNFHGARPVSYHAPENPSRLQEPYDPPPPTESVPIRTNRYDTLSRGYDVVGPYKEVKRERGYERNHDQDKTSRDYEVTSVKYESREDAVSPCESPPYAIYGGSGYERTEPGWEGGWENPPPPAPPYSARATPQAPGPPAYQAYVDPYSGI